MKINGIALAGAIAFAALAMTPQDAEAETFGCLVGGAGGGFGAAQVISGSGRTVATIAGALFGCAIGSRIQNNDIDRRAPRQVYQERRVIYQDRPVWRGGTSRRRDHWSDQWRGNERRYIQEERVAFVPGPRNDCPSNYTREYTTTVTVGGKPVAAYGTACYQPDGTWKLGPAVPAR